MRKHIVEMVCIGLVTLPMVACAPEPAEPERDANPPAATTPAPEGTTGAEPAGTVSLADIVAEPANYIGKTVTVVADVEEVYGPRAFALDEDAPLRGGIDNDLLVLSKKAGNLADLDDQWANNRVRVTGTIGRYSVVEIEREVGWDLEPEIEAELEGRGAVLIATSIERVQAAQ